MITREMEIAVLQDAVEILQRFARVKQNQEVREATNVIEVVIGELQDQANKVKALFV